MVFTITEEKKEDKVKQDEIDSFFELANMSDFITQRGSYTSSDVRISDIHKYLRNPQIYNKQIRNTSTYLTNKHGVLKDVIRMYQSLPTLKYSLYWTSDLKDGYTEEHVKLAQDFLKQIDVVQVLRDGLFETAEYGTLVTCLRSKKYVQFLDIDDLSINVQRNGKWVITFDLKSLESISDFNVLRSKIANLPPEVTEQKYARYKNKRDDSIRFIELKNCNLVNLDAKRGSPFGLPATMGSWVSILQKELIDNVERSVSNRLLKQLIVLQSDWIDKDGKLYADRKTIEPYFREVSKVVQKQESTGSQSNDSGVGTISLPHFLKLEALKIDTTLFKRELYDKISDDIYSNLGVSESIVSGKGGNYSSASVNESKFFSIIFTIVEQFESVINDYLSLVLPKGVECNIKFDRTTVLDKGSEIKNKETAYLQTGYITPWLEAVFNAPIEDIAAQRKHEISKGYEDIFKPALNAYTSSGKDEKKAKSNEKIDNDNTAKTRDDDGNSTPSPSD